MTEQPSFKDAPLRVAHLHDNTDWGGGETQLLALARRMQARGFFTVLVTPAEGILHVRARQSGLRVMPWVSGAWGTRRLYEDLREFDLTLLNAHGSGSTSLGQSLRRLLGIPLVLTRRVASPLRRNPFSIRKYSPQRLEGVIAISHTVRDVMISGGYPASRIRIAPSGVDTKALSCLRSDPAFRSKFGNDYLVGGIGKLSAKKNWLLMVRAAEILAREGFPVQWVLLGDGPEREPIKAALRVAGLEDRFHLPGFREDATRILRQFDVLCFPSLMEGASVTVREAMALGIPVVAVDTPGVVESLAGLGRIVNGNDPSAMAGALRRMLNDLNSPEQQKRVEQARRHAVEHYDFEQMVDLTIAAYDHFYSMVSVQKP